MLISSNSLLIKLWVSPGLFLTGCHKQQVLDMMENSLHKKAMRPGLDSLLENSKTFIWHKKNPRDMSMLEIRRVSPVGNKPSRL